MDKETWDEIREKYPILLRPFSELEKSVEEAVLLVSGFDSRLEAIERGIESLSDEKDTREKRTEWGLRIVIALIGLIGIVATAIWG